MTITVILEPTKNTIGTITSTIGHSALRNAYKLIEYSYLRKKDD